MGTNNGAMVKSDAAAFELALVSGDLSRLSNEERLVYYTKTCESVGLNPLTKPFDYITLNGKLTLYAKRDCTDQLRKIHRVSVSITNREKVDDLYVVRAKATTPDGREDESMGAVTIAGKKGDDLANALMKAETKAKRRVTLSICGLGVLDETEIETIPSAAQSLRDAAIRPVLPTLPANGETFEQDNEEKISHWRDRFAACDTAGELQQVAALLKNEPKAVRDALKSDYAKRKTELSEPTGESA